MQKKKYYLWKRGKVYYAKFRDPATGKIHGDVSTGYGNATRAQIWADQRYAEMERDAGKGDLTVKDWAGRFFIKGCPHVERLLDEGRRYADTTKQQNRKYVDTDILTDPIAEMRLADVSKAAILDFRTRLAGRRGRTRSAQMAYGALRIIIKEAVARDLIAADPTVGMKNLGYEKRRRAALTLAQMQDFLAMKHWPDLRYWRPTLCAALTGMRAGEVRGLQWGDVDADRNLIRVCHNLPCRIKKVTLPKWGKARVTVYPALLRTVIEPMRQPEGYVFGEGSTPLDYDMWAGAVEKAADSAKVPTARLHVLRHSIQTMLRGNGVSDDALRGAFGWSNASMQDNYTHRELYDLGGIKTAVDAIKLEKQPSGHTG